MASNPPFHIYIIAGEPSGDALGGRLMAELSRQTDGKITFSGVGGPDMQSQGLTSLFPMSDLSVMGIAEVLPQIPKLLRRISQVVGDVKAQKPDVVVTIDAPDFSFRVGKRLKNASIPLVHMVAPTVWAWRPGRARKVAGFLDHILCLFPFEPGYFEKEGLAATFIGHSIIETDAVSANGNSFRESYQIEQNAPVLALLPGSRSGEISRHLPVFRETALRLLERLPALKFVCVAPDHVAGSVKEALSLWPFEVMVIDKSDDKYDAMAAADVALAASGTVALELAVVGTPTVIGYQVNRLTAWIGKRLVKTQYASLINILLGREVMPEYLIEAFRAENLEPKLFELFSEPETRSKQIDAFNQAVTKLSPGVNFKPSEKAALTILDTVS